MTDDQFRQTEAWDKERRDIMRKVDKFAGQFVNHRGYACRYVEQQLNLIHFALGQMTLGDFKQIAEDNQERINS